MNSRGDGGRVLSVGDSWAAWALSRSLAAEGPLLAAGRLVVAASGEPSLG